MAKTKAMQYTGGNLAAIISNFGVNAECVAVNFANQSVKLGAGNAKRLHLNEWVVLDGDKLSIIPDLIAQNILSTKG